MVRRDDSRKITMELHSLCRPQVPVVKPSIPPVAMTGAMNAIGAVPKVVPSPQPVK